VASLLALSGAVLWGVGDFLGGLASRRLAVVAVLAISQAVGLAGVALWVWIASDPFPGLSEILPAAAAGVAGLIGLGALYRGLAVGAMGIVAPISAASPVVPLVVDAGRGLTPTVLQLLGIVLVLVGIVTLSREPRGVETRRIAAGAGLAVVAALGFGGFIVGLDAGSDESAPWAVVAARSASVAFALAAAALTTASLRPPVRFMPALVAVGAFDTGQRLRRLRDHERLGWDRCRAERALPDRDRRPRPPRACRATERRSSHRRRHCAGRRCRGRFGLMWNIDEWNKSYDNFYCVD
jgi:drug/metabolite transporter (DMT)-like permease